MLTWLILRFAQILRLYQPLETDVISSDEEEGTQLLPTHTQLHQSKTFQNSKFSRGPTRLGDVWDEREELFDIGGDSDDDDDRDRRGSKVVASGA